MKYQVFKVTRVGNGSNEHFGFREVKKDEGVEPHERGLAEFGSEENAIEFIDRNSGQLGKLTIIKTYE